MRCTRVPLGLAVARRHPKSRSPGVLREGACFRPSVRRRPPPPSSVRASWGYWAVLSRLIGRRPVCALSNSCTPCAAGFGAVRVREQSQSVCLLAWAKCTAVSGTCAPWLGCNRTPGGWSSCHRLRLLPSRTGAARCHDAVPLSRAHTMSSLDMQRLSFLLTS